MDVNQASILFGLLSLLALLIGGGALAILIMGRTEQARPLMSMLVPLAFVVALVCTVGSLYYSGVAHFRPCRLCWWQRIMMYPLVPVLGVGALLRDRFTPLYALPLAAGGLGYAIYHTQLQWFPDQTSACEAEAPCTSVWVDTFGFISIPFMAGAGFLAIAGLLALHWRLSRAPQPGREPGDTPTIDATHMPSQATP